VFWPTLVLFVVGGVLDVVAGNSFALAWAAGAAGALTGDLLFFYLGKSHRESVVDAWFVNGDTKEMQRATKAIDAKGPWAVITSKARGIARAFVPIAAGIREMPYAQFIAASAVSAVLWAGVLLSLRFVLSFFGK
jgi:undecaprenyl-diphosphatase